MSAMVRETPLSFCCTSYSKHMYTFKFNPLHTNFQASRTLYIHTNSSIDLALSTITIPRIPIPVPQAPCCTSGQ